MQDENDPIMQAMRAQLEMQAAFYGSMGNSAAGMEASSTSAGFGASSLGSPSLGGGCGGCKGCGGGVSASSLQLPVTASSTPTLLPVPSSSQLSFPAPATLPPQGSQVSGQVNERDMDGMLRQHASLQQLNHQLQQQAKQVHQQSQMAFMQPVPPPRDTAAQQQREWEKKEWYEREQQRERELNERKKQAKQELAKRSQVDKAEAEKLRCHLHKKPKENSCKFCKKYVEFVNKGKQDQAAEQERLLREFAQTGNDGWHGELELANSKTFGLPPLLQSHVVESQHYKSLMSLHRVDQVVDEIKQFGDGLEPYMANSQSMPSPLFVCLYRLFTLGINSQDLRSLVDGQNFGDENKANAFVRCAGFLFVRFGMPPEQYWPWLGEYVLDDEEFRPSKDGSDVTIGEFVEALLSQEHYYSVILPRLPMSAKRQLEAKLAQVPQFRKRTRANRRILEVYRDSDVRVEACLEDGTWVRGHTLHLDESMATRPKVHLRLDDGREESVHIGKVILADSSRRLGRDDYGTHRGRSRSRSHTDWARYKGKAQAELVDEQRNRDRDKAVCSSGKEYAKKPLGVKASCALPRDMGSASHRLMEDETYVRTLPPRRTSELPEAQREVKKDKPSAEHQAQMQKVFEKYVLQASSMKTQGSSSQQQNWHAEGAYDAPDVMRLG